MASGYTANYGLCQWQPEDQFVREEFNQDNAKIDAALGQKMEKNQLLCTATSDEKSNSILIDLSDVDWGKYEYVLISMLLPPNTLGDEEGNFQFSLNDGMTGGYNNHNASFAWTKCGPFLLVLFPFHDATRAVQGIMIADTCGCCVGYCTFEELTSVKVSYTSSSHYLTPGLMATVWGA